MKVTSEKVEAYKIDKHCHCGVGVMRPTGSMLPSSPPQYPHVCTHCDAKDNYFREYPYIEYKIPSAEFL